MAKKRTLKIYKNLQNSWRAKIKLLESSPKTTIVLSVGLIFLLQLLALSLSFQLALFGDDLTGFWNYFVSVGPEAPSRMSYLKFFFTPYGPQHLNLGLMYYLFGTFALPYFIFSFFYRFLVALALYFLTYKLTNNYLSAFFAAAFFAASFIGLDATNWVFNMIAYIGMIPLVFFTYFYFRAKETNKTLDLIFAFVLLFLAIVIVPTRMHGALALVITLELLWILIDRNHKALKRSLIRLGLVAGTFLLIKSIGTSFANPQETITRLQTGLNTILELVQKRQYEVFFYPFAIFGNLIIPDTLWNNLQAFVSQHLGASRPYLKLSIAIYASSLILGYLFLGNKNSRKPLIIIAFVEFGFTLFVWMVRHLNQINFSRSDYVGGTLVGGYVLIQFLTFLYFRSDGPNKFRLGIMALTWAVAFFIMPWLFYPYIVYPTSHRYLIISAIGIGLLWGVGNLLKINRRVFLAIFLIILIMQIWASNDYLSTLAQRRGSALSDKIWSVLDKELPQFRSDKNEQVIYFASDTNNGDIVYGNVFFGFAPKMAVKYHIWDSNQTPVAITTYPDLVSMVTDAQVFKAQGRPVRPLPLGQVYAYYITGQTPQTIQVLNITNSVRADLAKRIEQYQASQNKINPSQLP